MGRLSKIDKLTIKLKKELTNPKISGIKKMYLVEKIRMLAEHMVKK
ncbi:MAG: hypothetical protein IPM51_13415 [Sphingobacteriaceae bacterium]|nr:hypothetical protein [Sphingobacteriaceae bacterium]